MIKAYLAGITTQFENEDIQIKYNIYNEQELICEKRVFQGYRKPLVVSHTALLLLLKELKKYMKSDITIIINDAALNEQIRGTSTTKNMDVLKMANKVREELSKFQGSITIKDVSGNYAELVKWNDILK